MARRQFFVSVRHAHGDLWKMSSIDERWDVWRHWKKISQSGFFFSSKLIQTSLLQDGYVVGDGDDVGDGGDVGDGEHVGDEWQWGVCEGRHSAVGQMQCQGW